MSFFRVIAAIEDTGSTAVELAADQATNALKVFQVNNPTLSVTPSLPSELIDNALLTGDAFFYSDQRQLAAVDDEISYEIVVPDQATERFFLSFVIACQYECWVTLIEGGTMNATTAGVWYNRDRNSAGTTAATVGFLADDPATGGTIIYNDRIGSEKLAGSPGHENGDLSMPWILDNNTEYQLRIISKQKENEIAVHLKLSESTI